jgi:hypothetical protein
MSHLASQNPLSGLSGFIPPAPDDNVHCAIFHVSLEEEPHYEALSYCWGNAAFTEQIFLEGCPFQATVNLVSALRHLRLKNKARTMWVDAICIDQSNLAERSQQVGLMAMIYAMAHYDLL